MKCDIESPQGCHPGLIDLVLSTHVIHVGIIINIESISLYQKEKKEWIGSTLKYHFLINRIKNIEGFKEESKDIVELFNEINIPEININSDN